MTLSEQTAAEIIRIENEVREANRRCTELAAKVDFAEAALKQAQKDHSAAMKDAKLAYKALMAALGGPADGYSG